MHNQIDHDVRRLVATATTGELVRYVQDIAGKSYTRGFQNGYWRREDAPVRTVLSQCVRRSLRRLARRLL